MQVLRHLNILVIITVLLALIASGCSSCGDKKTHVMAMWSTDETDLAYQRWTKLLEEEFARQGIDAEIHDYYGHIGLTYEGVERQRIAEFVHGLESAGKCPDLIVGCGDFVRWQLQRNLDSLVNSIPAVCFAQKNHRLLGLQIDDLKTVEGKTREHLVQIHDTLELKNSLDFVDFLEEYRPLQTKRSVSGRSHRYVGLLDKHPVWIDSLIWLDLRDQINKLDRDQYISLMDSALDDNYLIKKNDEGVIQFATTSYKTPGYNVNISYQPLMWQYYRSMSKLRFIQIKHDEVSRSVSEGPPIDPYYTMTGEDFLVNDSCVGGHFASAEAMIADAVSAGKRLLQGESAESIGRLLHTPGYHVNWNLMRSTGAKISDMPDFVQIYNSTLYDRDPHKATVIYSVIGIILAVLFIISIIFSVRGFIQQRRSRMLMNEQLKQQIFNEQLLELAITACGSKMWDDRRGNSITDRVKASEEWVKVLEAFYANNEEGLYKTQFYGRIDDDSEDHWYNVRMDVRIDNGKVRRGGYVINIDHTKEMEEKTREAHEVLVEARTREGFISAMNHEIRTPLHAIVGFSMELARPEVKFTKEEIDMFADIIDSNAASLKKIINDILLVTLMKNTNVAAHCTECSMKSLLDSNRWQEAMLLTKRRHNKVEIADGGENVLVNADPQMVATVMENLIINASMFSAEGSTISIGWDNSNEGPEIWVSDQGEGIDPRHHDMIFERFSKINSFSPGCGLGLFISRTYMRKMGGSIGVESNLGEGARFTLRFYPPTYTVLQHMEESVDSNSRDPVTFHFL